MALNFPDSLRPYRRYLLPAILLFVLLLIVTMPARVLLTFVDVTQAGVYAQGVSGPWYAAAAVRVRVVTPQLAVDLTNVKWRLRPRALLRGRLMLVLDAEFAQRPVSAAVGAGVGGGLLVQNLRATLPLQEFQPLMTNLLFPIDGQVNLQDVSLKLKQQWPAALSGKILLANVTVATPAQLLDVGNVFLGLGMRDNSIVVPVIDNSGLLGLGGQLTLRHDHRFGLLLTSTPSERLSRELRAQMQALLGRPDNGQFSLRYDGAW